MNEIENKHKYINFYSPLFHKFLLNPKKNKATKKRGSKNLSKVSFFLCSELIWNKLTVT